MKIYLLSLLVGTALVATIGVAQADESMALSKSQMDQVNAGNSAMTINSPQVILKNGVVTINGVSVPLQPGVNIEVIGSDLILSFSSGVKAKITDPTSLTVVTPAAK